MGLKIRKTTSGTYYIPNLSIKQLRDMSTKQKEDEHSAKTNKTSTLILAFEARIISGSSKVYI